MSRCVMLTPSFRQANVVVYGCALIAFYGLIIALHIPRQRMS